MPTPNPQQLPAGATHGMEDGDYTRHVTFNDDVAGENIKFLLMCVIGLGETRLLDPSRARWSACAACSSPRRRPAGACSTCRADHDGRPAGAPAGARSYEPRALATHTTQTNVQQLFHYFRLTGDRKYLARVPEAIAWLEELPADAEQIAENPLLAGPHAPDLRRAGHQPSRVRAPLRLQHPQRRLLLRPRPSAHAEPLLGGPQQSTSPACRATYDQLTR